MKSKLLAFAIVLFSSQIIAQETTQSEKSNVTNKETEANAKLNRDLAVVLLASTVYHGEIKNDWGCHNSRGGYHCHGIGLSSYHDRALSFKHKKSEYMPVLISKYIYNGMAMSLVNAYEFVMPIGNESASSDMHDIVKSRPQLDLTKIDPNDFADRFENPYRNTNSYQLP